MTVEAATARRRGRPPNDDNRRAVLDATRSVIAEVGYDRLTFQAVAQRAGLYRRYINRTWTSKAELVRDALFEGVYEFDTPDQGSLEADLRLLVAQQVELITRPHFQRGIGGLEVEFRLLPSLFNDTVRRYVGAAADAAAEVFERAVERGELERAPDPALPVTVVSGAVQQAHALGIVDRDGLVDLGVAVLLGGVLTRPVGR